jgi:hypothetical protein
MSAARWRISGGIFKAEAAAAKAKRKCAAMASLADRRVNGLAMPHQIGLRNHECL